MLLIQNRGLAPVESYTLLGASGSRHDANLIGQFGTGAKHAITTLLRAGKKVTIYCGLTRLEFKTKPIEIEDRIEHQVYVQFGGTSKKKQDLGWVVNFGSLDWSSNLQMALREFISNAIDRTVRDGATVRDAVTECDLIVDYVPDEAARAQDGYTRVYIEECEACVAYVSELNRRFLHFGPPRLLNQRILPKSGEYPNCQIYYNGVWVRELPVKSLCDYNFTGSQIKIDDSRNLDDYAARAAIGYLYRDAEAGDVSRLLQAVKDGTDVLETSLDGYYLKPASWQGASEKQRDVWKAAWSMVFGEDALVCGKNQRIEGECARRKGYMLGVVNSGTMQDVIKAYGIKGAEEVVTQNEKAGRTVTAPTFEAIDAVNAVWEWVSATDLVGEAKKPHVKGFDQITDAEADTLGYYEDGVVYLRNDLGGQLLLETALEEVTHAITGSGDNSRDFQNFLLRLVTRWLA